MTIEVLVILTVTATLAGLGKIGQIALRRYVEGVVQRRFQKDQAEDNSRLRKLESRLSELSGLAIASAGKRQALIQERRLNAIDAIWTEAAQYVRFRFQATALQRLKIDELGKAASNDENVRKFAELLCGGLDKQDYKATSQLPSRPYVSEQLWAAFDAYATVMAIAYGLLSGIANGIPNIQKLFDWEKINELLKIALPHQSEFVDAHPQTAAFFLGDELEKNLLKAVRAELNGEDPDAEALERAANLISLAEQLREQSAERLR